MHPDDVDPVALFDDLVRVEIRLWDAVDRRLRAEHDLPLARWEPLRVVATTPSCRVLDVSRALRITVGGASKLVDRLAASGLVTRTPDPADGRSSVLTATPSGRALLADASRTVATALDDALAGVDPTALGRLAAGLAAVRSTPEENR